MGPLERRVGVSFPCFPSLASIRSSGSCEGTARPIKKHFIFRRRASMSFLDRNIFELQPLEIRQLLATGTASIDGTNTLQVGNLSGAATVIVNKISNGKIVVTIDGTAVGPSGTSSQFTLGNSAGQFNKINI